MHLYSAYSNYGSVCLCWWKSAFGVSRDTWAKLKPKWIWGDGRHMSCQFHSSVIFWMYLIIHWAYITKTKFSLVWLGRNCGWKWGRGMTEKDHGEGRQGMMKEDKQPVAVLQAKGKKPDAAFQRGMTSGPLSASLEDWKSGLMIQMCPWV